MTGGDGKASRKKGDPRKVLRVMNKKGRFTEAPPYERQLESWTNQEASTMITGSPSQ
ncbi:hypothetical protein M433DRAFT_160540 [Acidomyces richmondensis BFW]|nr:hypothetical protein M433DRAFT_160540 [Acidomyces richmondensis BFW]